MIPRIVVLLSFTLFFLGFTSTTYACVNTVSFGSRGSDVGCIQRMLTITEDYTYGEITDYFGPATQAAVQRFQIRNNIVTSGTPETTGFGGAGIHTRLAILKAVLDHLIKLREERFGQSDNSNSGSSGGGKSGRSTNQKSDSSDTSAPTVKITHPTRAIAEVGEILWFRAEASDNVKVIKVEMIVNGQVVDTFSAEPFNSTYKPSKVGALRFSAVAYDAAGNKKASDVVLVEVVQKVDDEIVIGPSTVKAYDLKGWTVQSVDSGAVFYIDWGDGKVKSGAKTVGEKVWHRYTEPGTYVQRVTITLSNSQKKVINNPVSVAPLQYLICDLKRPIAQRELDFDKDNYRQIIDALKNKLGCNGIRVGIDSKTALNEIEAIAPDTKPEGYTKLYRDVVAYAKQKGLLIYANMLPEPGVLNYGGDVNLWSQSIIRYTKHFCPDFIGPFNEEGYSHVRLVNDVLENVSTALKKSQCQPAIVAVDNGSTVGAKKFFTDSVYGDNILQNLDIASAHNNGNYGQFTKWGVRAASGADWIDLKKAAGNKPLWASESSRQWSNIDPKTGIEYGIKAMFDAGVVNGLVIYLSQHFLTESNGTYTLSTEGEAFVEQMCGIGWGKDC